MSISPEQPPIIGDDGELLQADTSFKQTAYVSPVDEMLFTPLPRLYERRFPWKQIRGYSIAAGVLVVVVLFYSQFFQTIAPHEFSTSRMTAPTKSTPTPEPTIIPNEFSISRMAAPTPKTIVAQNTLKKSGTIRLTAQSVRDVRWSRVGEQLGALTTDGLVIWNDVSGHPVIIPNTTTVAAFDWSPDGEHVVIGKQDGIAQVWTIQGQPVTTLAERNFPPETIWKLDWSPSGTMIAIGYSDQRTLSIFSVETHEKIYHRVLAEPLVDLDWFPTGNRLLLVMPSQLFQWQNGNVTPFALQYIGPTWTQADLDGALALVGNTVLKGELAAVVMRFNLLSRELVWASPVAGIRTSAQLRKHTEVKWAADKPLLAVFTEGDQSVSIWDGQSGEQLDTFEQPTGEVITSIDWSPDGQYLAVGSASQIVIVRWELK